MLWSVIIIGAIHLACGVVGGLVFARKHPLVALTIPVVALGTGMLMAFISSSIVGASNRPTPDLDVCTRAYARAAGTAEAQPEEANFFFVRLSSR